MEKNPPFCMGVKTTQRSKGLSKVPSIIDVRDGIPESAVYGFQNIFPQTGTRWIVIDIVTFVVNVDITYSVFTADKICDPKVYRWLFFMGVDLVPVLIFEGNE